MLQFLNGAGQSSKDRVALSMIQIVTQPTYPSGLSLTPPAGRRTRYPKTSFRRHNLRGYFWLHGNLLGYLSPCERLSRAHVRFP